MYGPSKVHLWGKSFTTATLDPSKNHPALGDYLFDGDEVYQWVYNAGNSQASVGYGLVHSVTVGTGAYSLTVSSTTSVDFAVCVVKHSTLTTGTYGWGLKKGMCPAKALANSGLAAGTLLVLGGDGAWANKDVSTGYVGNIAGKTITQTASAGVAVAYFQLF